MFRQGLLALVGALACLAACLAIGAGSAAADTPTATLLGARAVAPPSAPPAVKAMIRAANHIRHRPYVWGGGHRKWNMRGYDCSGSVSYVLHAAGLLDSPLVSTGFMKYGKGGGGQWVRIYANHGHVFMVIAGLRWDTAGVDDGDRSGPGWSVDVPYGRVKHFRERHPLGVENATPLWPAS
jgi:hypothetical protein